MNADHYKINKDFQKIIIRAYAFPEEDYGIDYIQIKLADLPAVIETLKNIDHDPSKEGVDEEGDGRFVNELLYKENDDYLLCIETKYDYYGYNTPLELRIMALWKDKSVNSHEVTISYWNYDELKNEVNRLIDAIEESGIIGIENQRPEMESL